MIVVTVDEGRESLQDLVADAKLGVSVFIVRDGVPIAKIVTVSPEERAMRMERPRRVAGSMKDVLPPLPDSFFDPLPEEELRLWGQ